MVSKKRSLKLFGKENGSDGFSLDEFYDTTKKYEQQKSERNSLLNSLGSSLTPAEVLYSTVDDLKKKKQEKDRLSLKSPTAPNPTLKGVITGGASGLDNVKTDLDSINSCLKPDSSIKQNNCCAPSQKPVVNSSPYKELSPNYYRTPIADIRSRDKYMKQNSCKVNEKKTIPGINACKGSILPINPGYKLMAKRNFIDNDKFNELMTHIYAYEGGFSDKKSDLGGRTNFGVTQSTFDYYNKKYNFPLKDVKDITYDEADNVYYKLFYNRSNVNEIDDPLLSLMHFDAAINHGPMNAKKFLKQSGGDVNKYYELRLNHYRKQAQNVEGQNLNYNGWLNRLNKIKSLQDLID